MTSRRLAALLGVLAALLLSAPASAAAPVSKTWAGDQIRLYNAYTAGYTGRGVTVAVLDTLAEAAHPELAGKVTTGPDFVTNPCSGQTSAAGHGTAVAGIVGARTDNGQGIAAMGWNTRVLSVGVLDDCGIGSGAAIARGIRYAVDAGARIVNMSLAGDASPVLADAVAASRSVVL